MLAARIVERNWSVASRMGRLNLIPTMRGVSQASQLGLLIRPRLELDLSIHSPTNTTQSPLLGNGLEFYSGKFMRKLWAVRGFWSFSSDVASRFRQHDLILSIHNLREETGTSIAFLPHDERSNIAFRFILVRTLVCGVTDRYIALGFSRMCWGRYSGSRQKKY